jgi:hypothetical protein
VSSFSSCDTVELCYRFRHTTSIRLCEETSSMRSGRILVMNREVGDYASSLAILLDAVSAG